LTTLVNNQLSGLVEIYKDLHAHPELSHQESRTSALLATELRKAGYAVTEHIGKYSDGTNAYGVVAVLEDGPGPRLLIRGDMDALPVVEETGCRAVLKSWTEIGVLHLNRGQLKYSVTAGRNVLMPGSLYGDVFMRLRGPRMTAHRFFNG
jgi:metal-dependent amidase/aminoacylase/carboxypeptidase family protein